MNGQRVSGAVFFLVFCVGFVVHCGDSEFESGEKFGVFEDAPNYSILRFFEKARRDQGSADIVYPICVYGSDGITLPRNVQNGAVDVMNKVANEWNDAMYGLYGWSVNSITFQLINAGTQDCDLDDDRRLDRKWYANPPTGNDETEYHRSYPGLPVFRLWAPGDFGCGASQSYWINRMNISYQPNASDKFCNILGEAVSGSANHIDVLLHEFGHQLCLADTYDRGDQPASMMNNLWVLGNLTPDDVYGAAHAWRVVDRARQHEECPEGYYLNTSSTGARRCHPEDQDITNVFMRFDDFSGQCAEATETRDGATVAKRNCSGGDGQRWDLLQNPDGTYVLKNRRSGRCLDVGDGTVRQRACDTNRIHQKFLVHADEGGPGLYGLQSYSRNNCLDPYGSQLALRSCHFDTQAIDLTRDISQSGGDGTGQPGGDETGQTGGDACTGNSCWVMGNRGESCDTVCRNHNGTCIQSMLGDLDTPEEVSQVAEANGVSCEGTRNWSYASNPGMCTSPSCCGGSCVNICAYGTGASPSCSVASSGYSRFCPCEFQDTRVGHCVGDTCWILGNRGQSCDAVCRSHDRTCNQGLLGDIDTAAEVSEIAEANGLSCNGTQGWAYASNPGVCTSPSCCGGGCVNTCTYGTGASQSCSVSNGDYSRLCPCDR